MTPWPLSVLTEVEQPLKAPRKTIAVTKENRSVRIMVPLSSSSEREEALSVFVRPFVLLLVLDLQSEEGIEDEDDEEEEVGRLRS